MQKNETNQARVFRMISPSGFVNLFWEVLKDAQSIDQPITHQQAFDQLNNEYYEVTGRYRYKNFQTFKTLKDK
ncbi:MAG: hypothetical protein WCJ95_09540 [Mariniphaga sp.]